MQSWEKRLIQKQEDLLNSIGVQYVEESLQTQVSRSIIYPPWWTLNLALLIGILWYHAYSVPRKIINLFASNATKKKLSKSDK